MLNLSVKNGFEKPSVWPLSNQNGVSPPLPPLRYTPPRMYSPVSEERKVKFAVPVALAAGMEVMFMEKERAPLGTVVE